MAVTTNIKRKKKSWVAMYAPNYLNKAFLGETLTADRQAVVGKTLTLNLSIFTKDMKKQSTDVTFKVKSVVENNALTDVVGVSLTNSYIKRLVRRGKSKVEDSFEVTCKDNSKLRLKPIVVTNNVVNQSITTKIRHIVKEQLTELVKSNSAQGFFEILFKQKAQKELKDKLSKVYPLRYVDLRVAKLVFSENQPEELEVEKESVEEESKEEKAKVVEK